MITITRTDRAHCRKWTQAHRKGKPTAEITREWLGNLRAPKGLCFAGLSDACVWTVGGENAPSSFTDPALFKISFAPSSDIIGVPSGRTYYAPKQKL